VSEKRVQRRLAAILAADIVGYSRLMEADEEGTRARVRNVHSELIDPQISADGGRIVKTMGDGILVEFPSAVDAVCNALAIQSAMAGRNAALPDGEHLVFRVGINLGDIIIEDDDIHGDGVNVAARLEGLCEPGGVYVSGTVRDHVEGKLDALFDDLGEQAVKNIERPVHVYAVSLGNKSEATTGTVSNSEKASIAVLPFDNLSGDPEQEYFADGIAEDIITALSRARWFRVVSRNSSFSYKGQSPDGRQVAKDLGAAYVLEGSVRKAGNRVRITAELINGATGNQIWAERYDRELEDIFEVQDNITRSITGAIEPQLRKAEFDRAVIMRPESLNAWDVYQRGMWELSRKDNPNYQECLSLFQRAAVLDANFEPAYAGVAEACFYLVHFAHVQDHNHYIDLGIEAARRAIEIDGEDPAARWALGRLYMKQGDYEEAQAEIETAIRLNPFSAEPHRTVGRILNDQGKYSETVEAMNEALRLCPNDPAIGIVMARLAEAYFHLGDYDQAVLWSRRALRGAIAPRLWGRATFLAAMGHKGDMDGAKRVLTEMLAQRPEFSLSFTRKHYPITLPEAVDRFVDGLRKAGVPE